METNAMNITRRWFTLSLSVVPFALKAANGAQIKISYFDKSDRQTGALTVNKIVKTEEQWREQLTSAQFEVTRHRGTERAFTGKYAKTKDKGVYQCVCCFTPLFHSSTKFESGTGWPSFYAPIAKENVSTSVDTDIGVERNEVHCSRCDAHLGHVFDDGPQPTGLRYCMNSASFNFIPAEG